MNASSLDYRGSCADQPHFYSGQGSFDPDTGMIAYEDSAGLLWSHNGSSEVLKIIEDYEFDPRDVTVNGYPKSGTNWMQIMIANLYDDWGTTTQSLNCSVPQLEIPNGPMFEGLELVLSSQHPRLTKSHLPVDRMPRSFRDDNIGRVIYIYRNPKDICVSFFHELSAFTGAGFSLPFDKWVANFVAGKAFYGSWLDHVLGWTARKAGVLHLSYEAILADPSDALDRVTTFLGRSVTRERFDYVVKESAFERMKDGALGKQLNIGIHDHGISPFMRGGKSGGWRDMMTETQSRMIDDAWGPALEAAGIHFAD